MTSTSNDFGLAKVTAAEEDTCRKNITGNAPTLEVTGMGYNDQVTLKANFDNWKEARAEGLPVDPCLFYCVEQFVKPFDLSDEEILDGITDGGHDVGVDAIFFIVNRGALVRDDTDVDHRNTTTVNLILIQVKSGDGFQTNEVNKMYFFADDLLDLSRDAATFRNKYNPRLIEIMRVFKEKYRLIAGGFPDIAVDFYYIIKGDERKPGPNELTAADKVKAQVKQHLDQKKTKCNFNFINLQALLEQVSSRRPQERELIWSEPPMQTNEGYVGLVKLKDYYDFIRDEHGLWAERLFEANVRGYQLSSPVNKEIRATLRSDGQANFWLLNNGVTIIADKAQPAGHLHLKLQDPQIVNGLQTSREIFRHISESPLLDESRAVLVKVIETTDAATQDAIIRATNSQNKMQEASLRATETIHRQIEELFKRYELFYDRRKGFYRDQSKPIAKIISLTALAQAVVAILLQRPHDARGGPQDFIKDNAKYKLVFGKDEYPLVLYLTCIQMMKRIEGYLAQQEGMTRADVRNIKYYVATLVGCLLTQSTEPPAERLALVNVAAIDEALLQDSYRRVWKMYQALGGNDTVAKGPNLVKRLRTYIKRTLTTKARDVAAPESE